MRTLACFAVGFVCFLQYPASLAETLFPTDLPSLRWSEFHAAGFSQPVSGVIYRSGDNIRDGLPLGGIDTGCIDLEPTGLSSWCTIFNTHVPRRGPVNYPFLGLAVGDKTWLLCVPKPRKWERVHSKYPPPPEPGFQIDWNAPKVVSTAREIHMWGHYPVADMEFETDAPVQAGLFTWSPFLPGDIVNSVVPAAVFEVLLRNTTDAEQAGTVAFAFRGPLREEAGGSEFASREIEGNVRGIEVSAPRASFLVGAIAEKTARVGGELMGEADWARIAKALPARHESHAGASVAVDFHLAPGASRTVRFVLAWSAPTWNGGGYNWFEGGNLYKHMYTRYYPTALSAAEHLAENHETLLRRVLAWQAVVYGDQNLPTFLRDALVNSLHLITETSMWAQARDPLPGWVRADDGLFGMNECPRQCPQIECIPCTFYGGIPITYFFPELALSTLRGYKGYQYKDGRPPWIFGGSTGATPPVDFASPVEGYQFVLNGSCYAEIFNKLWLRTGRDPKLLEEFYDSLKRATVFTMTLRPDYGAKQIVSMPTGNAGDEWFESTQFLGLCTHVGGVHLAHLQMARDWAQQIGDEDFAKTCQKWIEGGSDAMEEHLWAGSYYSLYHEPETQKRSDVVMGYQLDGEWMSHLHGYGGVFRRQRALDTLDTLKRINANPELCTYGALLFADPDGSIVKDHPTGYWTDTGSHLPSVLMLGMTYVYLDRREFGLEVIRRGLSNMIIDQRAGWDWGIVFNPQRPFDSGSDYYQDLVIWSIPAALAGQDLSGPTRSGGLVDRVLRAANTGK